MSNDYLDIPNEAQGIKPEDRVRLFGRWLYRQVSPGRRTALQTIRYVLYGGEEEEIPQRIFETCCEPDNMVPNLGVSSLGEIVGWVFPDSSPVRNDRTNKALCAIGYPVKVYSK